MAERPFSIKPSILSAPTIFQGHRKGSGQLRLSIRCPKTVAEFFA